MNIRLLEMAVLAVALSVFLECSAVAKLPLPSYWAPRFSSEGLDPHWVRDAQTKVHWGYIDSSGKFVIPPIYDEAYRFCHGSACVRKGQEEYRIDKTGKAAKEENQNGNSFETEYDDTEIAFTGDIFDESGTKLIAPGGKDITVYQFHDGLAKYNMPMRLIEKYYSDCYYARDVIKPVTKAEEELARKHGYYGYLNESGRIVTPPRFYKAGPFKGGLAQVQLNTKTGNLPGGFINTSGTLIGGRTFNEVEPFSEGLALVKFNTPNEGAYGFIDMNGKSVIHDLQNASGFANGVAPAKINGRWVLIDTTGRVVKEFDFDAICAFSGGFAEVTRDISKGFIDSKGRVAIPLSFADAGPFCDGLAPVAVPISNQEKDNILESHHDWKIGYINTKGQVAIQPNFIGARHFSEALAPALEGSKWGFIDKAGAFKIKPRFDDARSFSEGLAAVRVGLQWGYIDSTGAFVIEPKFKTYSADPEKTKLGATRFSEGVALVKNESWQYIDKLGKRLSIGEPGEFVEDRNGLHEGFALVHEPNERWTYCGLADKNGKIVAAGLAADSGPFSEELAKASVWEGGNGSVKVGYVNKTGTYVIPRVYDKGGDFKEGLAAVAHGKYVSGRDFIGKWGFIDKTGAHVINEVYDDVREFNEGRAAVRVRDKWGVIDVSGKLVVAPIYDRIDKFCDGLARVKRNEQYGFIDKSGIIKIPIKYWLAGDFSDGLAMIVIPANAMSSISTDDPLSVPVHNHDELKEFLYDSPVPD